MDLTNEHTVKRLADGYAAQMGASNISGMAHSLQRHLEAQEVRLDDPGLSLIVHQMFSLLPFPSYEEKVKCISLSTASPCAPIHDLIQIILDQCASLQTNGGNSHDVFSDSIIQHALLKLYTQTRAHLYDEYTGNAWSDDMDLCKQAYERGLFRT